MRTIKVRPVLVKTNKKSTFKGQLCLNRNHLFITRKYDTVGQLKPQELILISLEDEKIADNRTNFFTYDDLNNKIHHISHIEFNNLGRRFSFKTVNGFHTRINHKEVIIKMCDFLSHTFFKFIEVL